MADTPIVVVMGVSGSGKSTVGRVLALDLGWPFAEGDDMHPPANVARMHSGQPLTDAQRGPWLAAIAAWSRGQHHGAVVACSALRRSYRDVLRSGGTDVRFAVLDVGSTLLATRLEHRPGHFMPASLLASQLATLEPLQADEVGVTVAAVGPPGQVAADIRVRLSLGGTANPP
ncbi:MAG: gluconokinase [Actinomycetota bacterium]|nr:gluconokinase [Actinomycetota bacterium]